MTVVVDIPCPNCGETRDVTKEGLATYRCGSCGTEFDQGDVEPESIEG